MESERIPALEELRVGRQPASIVFPAAFFDACEMGATVPFGFIGYELVTLKEGVMSSRKGNVVTFQQLRDATLTYAREEVLKRHADWSEGKVTHTSWALAQAGVKFGMLRQDNDKVFVFDLEQALAFDGRRVRIASTRQPASVDRARRGLNST